MKKRRNLSESWKIFFSFLLTPFKVYADLYTLGKYEDMQTVYMFQLAAR